MFGGLLIAAADTGGQPSLAWRGHYAAKAWRRDMALASRTARLSGQGGAQAGRLRRR
jgi:hypothetical protein